MRHFDFMYLTARGDKWCLTVRRYVKDLKHMIDPNRVLIRAHAITIVYDYPLRHKWEFAHARKNGWTRADLVRAIQMDYKFIYRNANPYGIWGHSIRDLVIEGATYNPKTRKVTLSIGS